MESARGFAISSTKAEQYSTQDVAKAVPWIARLDHQVEVGVQILDDRIGLPAAARAGTGGRRFGLVVHLGANFRHVECPDFVDELLQRVPRQSTGLFEDENSVAERHQGWDGLDAEGPGKVRLVLGVDFAEHDVGVVPLLVR